MELCQQGFEAVAGNSSYHQVDTREIPSSFLRNSDRSLVRSTIIWKKASASVGTRQDLRLGFPQQSPAFLQASLPHLVPHAGIARSFLPTFSFMALKPSCHIAARVIFFGFSCFELTWCLSSRSLSNAPQSNQHRLEVGFFMFCANEFKRKHEGSQGLAWPMFPTSRRLDQDPGTIIDGRKWLGSAITLLSHSPILGGLTNDQPWAD